MKFQDSCTFFHQCSTVILILWIYKWKTVIFVAFFSVISFADWISWNKSNQLYVNHVKALQLCVTYCLLITKQRLKGEKIKVNCIKLTWVKFTNHDIRFVYTLKNSQCCISLAIENSVLHLLLINEYINSMWSNFNEKWENKIGKVKLNV